jgi:nitrous oxidase accessory protein
MRGILVAALLALTGWGLAGGEGARPAPAVTPAVTAPDSGRVVIAGSDAGPFGSISAALDAAAAGDTVRVGPGLYREQLKVERPVTLVGRGRPVVDAGGRGHVVEASAGITIRGFHLRNSGKRVDTEHAGIMVRDARAAVEDNRITDVLYGVYLKNAGGSLVRDNHIRGKDLPPPRRGDGIRLWYSSDTRILDNRVDRTRDVVVYFSNGLSIRGNVITDGRYGLHYMYSDNNEFRHNYFARNQVGAFIMYSADVRLEQNVFADSRGSSGMGIGLKDADRIVAEDNLIVQNESGIYFDNSPRAAAVTNHIRDNLFLYNGSGVRMLPSVRGNDFEGNSFVGNRRPAEVSGGMGDAQAAQNDWSGNHWSSYSGFDRDGDGVGDTPFRYARLTDDLLSRHDALRLFTRSPVMPVIEAVRRFFPLLAPEPVVVDPVPRLEARALSRWERSPPVPVLRAFPGDPRGNGPAPEVSVRDGGAGDR